jgi:hypothetical protein
MYLSINLQKHTKSAKCVLALNYADWIQLPGEICQALLSTSAITER